MFINGTVYLKKVIKATKKNIFFTNDESGPRLLNEDELKIIREIGPEALNDQIEVIVDKGFYLIFANDQEVMMHNYNSGLNEKYQNFSEVQTHFISLEDFLAMADYVGNDLILPAGSEFEKNGRTVLCTKNKPMYTILYALNEVLLVKSLNEPRKYQIIAKDELKNYFISGTPNPECADKLQVYQDIIAMIYDKVLNKDLGPSR